MTILNVGIIYTRLALKSQHLHYLFHCWTFRGNGFPTALDEIPCVICHSWTFQSMWAFPFCEESNDLKVAISLKRNSIKEHLLFKVTLSYDKLIKAETHRVIKAAKSINISFCCFASMLLLVIFITSFTVKLTTLYAHTKQLRCSET